MNKALAVKPDDPNVLMAVAQLNADFQHFDKAEAAVEKVLEKDPGHPGANFLKGRLLLVGNDYRAAMDRFDLVIRENPQNGLAHYYRALCFAAKGEGKLAEQDLLKAVELNPGLADARIKLAEGYLRVRNPDLAREQIAALSEQAPDDVRVLMLQGSLKVLERDPKGAEAAYRAALEKDPTYAPAYVRLGHICALTKPQEEAVTS